MHHITHEYLRPHSCWLTSHQNWDFLSSDLAISRGLEGLGACSDMCCAAVGAAGSQWWDEPGLGRPASHHLSQIPEVNMGQPERLTPSWLGGAHSWSALPGRILSCYRQSSYCWRYFIRFCAKICIQVFSSHCSLWYFWERHRLSQFPSLLNSPKITKVNCPDCPGHCLLQNQCPPFPSLSQTVGQM